MKISDDMVRSKIDFYKTVPVNRQNSITRGRLLSGSQSHLLACLPKSGSTWFLSIFRGLPGCAYASFTPSYGAREQEIESSAISLGLQEASGFHTLSQHHVKYNENTRSCLLEYCVRPIVLTRDIMDNLVSLVDHWKIDPTPMSSAYIEKQYFNEDMTLSINNEISPLEYATILHGPWILNFYLSWRKYSTSVAGGLPPCLQPIFVNYSDLCRNTFEFYFHLLNQMGFEVEEDELMKAIARAGLDNTRKNIGKPGRGRAHFSCDEGAATALERLLRLYRHEDLSGLGVGSR